ncbi:MAG: hypothetical protein AAF738_02615 [Bacteroidota bacterium]
MPNIFSFGSCWNFYELLKLVFPKSVAYYDCNHIITRIGDRYYDITGEVAPNKNHSPFQDYYHPERKKRVIQAMLEAEFPLFSPQSESLLS